MEWAEFSENECGKLFSKMLFNSDNKYVAVSSEAEDDADCNVAGRIENAKRLFDKIPADWFNEIEITMYGYEVTIEYKDDDIVIKSTIIDVVETMLNALKAKFESDPEFGVWKNV